MELYLSSSCMTDFMAWTVKTLHFFIFTDQKSAVFQAALHTKYTAAQQHYIQISCTGFHPDQTVSVVSADRNTNAKYDFSLRLFSRNSYPLYKCLWTLCQTQ